VTIAPSGWVLPVIDSSSFVPRLDGLRSHLATSVSLARPCALFRAESARLFDERGLRVTLGRATEAVLSAQCNADRIAKLTEFRFISLGDVFGSTGPLGEIWHVAGRPDRRSLLPELPDA